jgi:hypothetical protein
LEDRNLEAGRDISLEDFEIEKDEKKTVTISVVYTDYISLFGWRIKKLEFQIKKKEYEIKEML